MRTAGLVLVHAVQALSGYMGQGPGFRQHPSRADWVGSPERDFRRPQLPGCDDGLA
jgi:hypothetical protein